MTGRVRGFMLGAAVRPDKSEKTLNNMTEPRREPGGLPRTGRCLDPMEPFALAGRFRVPHSFPRPQNSFVDASRPCSWCIGRSKDLSTPEVAA